ncbi:MAG TPA: hypothetical protein VJM13_16315, partial [Sphingopyxis sp.]|nr:hypothetical protein [Sphingopyxis sp.]
MMTLLPAGGLGRLRRGRHPISVPESDNPLSTREESGDGDSFDEAARAVMQRLRGVGEPGRQ